MRLYQLRNNGFKGVSGIAGLSAAEIQETAATLDARPLSL